jgi:hypothetical protein
METGSDMMAIRLVRPSVFRDELGYRSALVDALTPETGESCVLLVRNRVRKEHEPEAVRITSGHHESANSFAFSEELI